MPSLGIETIAIFIDQNAIRILDPSNSRIYYVAGSNDWSDTMVPSGSSSAVIATDARFRYLKGIAVNAAGTIIYVTDENVIRKIYTNDSDNILKIDNKGEEFELQVAVPRTDDAMKFTVPKGKSTIVVNEFNQRGYTEDKKSVYLYRKANVYKEEALIKKEIGILQWPDFLQFEGETFPYKSQLK